MADPQIINTLANKRNEIEARIAAYEMEIERCRCDLAAVNATLALFAQEGELRPTMTLSRMFKRGEIFAICKQAIEATGKPLDTRELARAVAVAKGMDGDDRVLRKALALSVVTVLGMRAKRGQIGAAGKRAGVRLWGSVKVEC